MNGLTFPRLIKYFYNLNKRNFNSYFSKTLDSCCEEIVNNSVHWVGHATTIINIDNIIVVTDPVVSKNLGHIKRLVKPSVDLRKFHIDYILLSHGHMDHIDFKTLKGLNKDAVIIAPKQFKFSLKLLGFKKVFTSIETYDDENLSIKAIDAKHAGNRYPVGKPRNSYSYLIQRNSKKVFFAGDTSFTEAYKDIEADIALMPVGCYKPDEFKLMHCSPEESFNMFKMMNVKTMIPIHYKTYILAEDNDEDTVNTLNKLNDGSVNIIDIGQTVKF